MVKEVVYFVVYDEPAYRMTLPFIKIGKTCRMSKRLGALQVSSPIKLGYAGIIRTNDAYMLEKALHVRYKNDWIAGEWFKRTPGMIKSLRANYIIEGDRFDEFVDLSVSGLKERPLEYLPTQSASTRPIPSGVVIDKRKKLDDRPHNWTYNELKRIKQR